MKKKAALKKFPTFKSDKEAEDFVAEADLTEYDFSGFQPVRFEFQKKEARVNMRFPVPLLDAVKKRARKLGVPYQRLIREAVEKDLAGKK
jgi:predicted DNA binding CopG/RHH family protein